MKLFPSQILLQGGFQEVSAVGVRGETVEAADPPCHQLGAERNQKLEGEATSVSRQPDRKQPLAGAKKPILKELQKLGLIRNSASKSSGGVLKTVIKTRDGSKQDKREEVVNRAWLLRERLKQMTPGSTQMGTETGAGGSPPAFPSLRPETGVALNELILAA
uniref:Uncharacterized protein n=1 Tax=Chromera velia CCMP2878 TaxID=1169474 RepID=A0A0G4IBG9_9ALVE|eukprot:Cvel_12755.t1-p1 / transcript=Cvel_12755.t1 / gene=Cvel_12755 / organism=Chromera_velia_CCMP2878 / gene_product=hypothetical protein / transcript_product=hypothetical protein / location=Cvel_scaffold848:13933-17361(-) / protein_length=161 / sequence_SO=supercontig / SO=protein_coding / is_pseudo=false